VKRFLVLLSLLVTPAMAADLPVKAAPAPAYLPVSWSGLYVSGYGLYGANITNTTVNVGTVAADLASAPHGPGLGGSIGYNWEPTSSIVFGVRFDAAYANLQGGGTVAQQLSVSNATNWLGDADVILGLKLSSDGRFLGYTGAGFAFGGAKPVLTGALTSAALSDTSTGWNVLAGLAYQLDPHWQLFLEGNYFQLGDKSLTLPDGSATSLTKYHIISQKAGISYRF
jgi:outer membrane immunogenic protein